MAKRPVAAIIKAAFGSQGGKRPKLVRLVEEYGRDFAAIRSDLDNIERGIASMAVTQPVGNAGEQTPNGAPALPTGQPAPPESSEEAKPKRDRYGRSAKSDQAFSGGAA